MAIASYGSAARSSVGPHHVAVDDDLPLSKQLQVDTGPQRPSNEPLNLDGSAPLLPAHRLAWCPLLCGTREHRVLSRDPPLALAPHP
jgi:hypothetical protein